MEVQYQKEEDMKLVNFVSVTREKSTSKEVKTTRYCMIYCKLECSSKISNYERKDLFKSYDSLSTSENNISFCILLNFC
jgi:hypothetical protein